MNNGMAISPALLPPLIGEGRGGVAARAVSASMVRGGDLALGGGCWGGGGLR